MLPDYSIYHIKNIPFSHTRDSEMLSIAVANTAGRLLYLKGFGGYSDDYLPFVRFEPEDLQSLFDCLLQEEAIQSVVEIVCVGNSVFSIVDDEAKTVFDARNLFYADQKGLTYEGMKELLLHLFN